MVPMLLLGWCTLPARSLVGFDPAWKMELPDTTGVVNNHAMTTTTSPQRSKRTCARVDFAAGLTIRSF
jgi:hypothetical protein